MIAPRTEESLVNCSPHKGFVNKRSKSHLFGFKHVVKRITIFFQPKFVCCFNISLRESAFCQRIVFCRLNDHQRIINTSNGSCSFNKVTNEPIIPTFETVIWGILVADYIIIINVFEGFLAQPTFPITV